ncbi:glycoside hydrolase family 172 protein [Sunxiuqinia sp. A32]|uniref:glycoside hydrolase family 172 protein n=1 Tax=Sunxiuqinia sp. A32 TaxID=3461496 RepID=UPI0040465939
MKRIFYFLIFLLLASCTKTKESQQITLESLLHEMVSFDEATRYPSPFYSSLQVSSYDRHSISPDSVGWFANNDGFGIERIDTIDGRIEKVMFDQKGPGAITRIWITTIDKRGTWRFYFDGSENPGWVIPAYDLMQLDIPEVGRGLLQPHTSYEPNGKGGNTLFLPIPFAQSCKITFEDEPGVNPTPKYYHINYRKYGEGTKVETFSKDMLNSLKEAIVETDKMLLDPPLAESDSLLVANANLPAGDSLTFSLPEGGNALNRLEFNIEINDSMDYEQSMRQIIFQASFDGKQTCWVPLSDFSGGGMGAPYVRSWYLSSDGKGQVISHWVMPYRSTGQITLINANKETVKAGVKLGISKYDWDERSLYFHTSWKQEDGIELSTDPSNDKNCMDWNFATLSGRGIYKGDVLSLYNHAPAWYGEGDEKIWIDSDTFPSQFGTGTEDYYNSSWAPVVPFQTPFGGAPRADQESSHGYNTFFRTRNLDGIPFSEKLVFDIEMLGWQPGTVDYATTVFWYGDFDSVAKGTSGMDEATKKLVFKE